MTIQAPLLPNQLHNEAKEIAKFVSKTRKIPLWEWASVPFFGGLGVLFICGFETIATWARWIILGLLVVFVLDLKRDAVDPLAKIGIDLYAEAVTSVLHGITSLKGRVIAKVCCSRPYTVSWLLLITSMTTLVEQAQTAFTLPSLLKAQGEMGPVIGANSAFVLLLIVIANMLMHIFLFLYYLGESERIAEALPGLQARFDPTEYVTGTVVFEAGGNRKVIHNAQDYGDDNHDDFRLTCREAEYLSRNIIWTGIRDAAFQGNLMVVAAVCSEVLKQTAKELPPTLMIRGDEKRNAGILGENRNNSCLKPKMMFASHGADSASRIIFRMGASSLPKVILKLYCLDNTWADLDQAGRFNLIVAITTTTVTIGLAVPDTVSLVLKFKSTKENAKQIWCLLGSLTATFSIISLLIMILLKHGAWTSIEQSFEDMGLYALSFGVILAEGAYSLIIFIGGWRGLLPKESSFMGVLCIIVAVVWPDIAVIMVAAMMISILARLSYESSYERGGLLPMETILMGRLSISAAIITLFRWPDSIIPEMILALQMLFIVAHRSCFCYHCRCFSPKLTFPELMHLVWLSIFLLGVSMRWHLHLTFEILWIVLAAVLLITSLRVLRGRGDPSLIISLAMILISRLLEWIDPDFPSDFMDALKQYLEDHGIHVQASGARQTWR